VQCVPNTLPREIPPIFNFCCLLYAQDTGMAVSVLTVNHKCLVVGLSLTTWVISHGMDGNIADVLTPLAQPSS